MLFDERFAAAFNSWLLARGQTKDLLLFSNQGPQVRPAEQESAGVNRQFAEVRVTGDDQAVVGLGEREEHGRPFERGLPIS